MRMLVIALLLAVAQAAPDDPRPPTAREVAPGTYLLPGALWPGRGPDGNTVVLEAPNGLIVIDTGRHATHSDGILAFARSRKQPVAAIVNTHWHLDHSSGNRRVKAAYPEAKVHTTSAVDRAISPAGFLGRELATATKMLSDPATSPAVRKQIDVFAATMAAAETLRPEVTVDRSTDLALAGRTLTVNVAPNAVTDADLWLFDKATGVAVIGDLVTVPVPFFESACPRGWQEALDAVAATPFRLVVPGHGDPMTRGDFEIYRQAFSAFRTCAAGDRDAAACAGDWIKDVAPLLHTDDDRRRATQSATFYVGFLRKNGGASPDCLAK